MGGPTQSGQRMPTIGPGARPVPVADTDYNERVSLNTTFGEKVIAVRKSDIASQFQYGFPASGAVQETANGGSISIVESMLVVSTGTNTAGSASIANKKALRYVPGQEAYINFTAVFSAPKTGSYQRAGIFNDVNGFFIGYEDKTFKVTRRRDSEDSTVDIDLTSIFDPDVDDFDPTKNNVYRISFGYLGAATISYEVLSPSGHWEVLHKIRYPNTATETHILNTNLQPKLSVANTGNNTDIQAKTGSFAAGVIDGGGNDASSRRFTYAASNQTITAGTLTVITFRSKASFNSLVNYITSRLMLLSFNADMSKSSLWEFEKNGTIVGTPTWTDVDTADSVIEYSTNAVVTKGTGSLEFSVPLGKVDRVLLDNLENQLIELLPEEYMTIYITTPLGTTGTYDLSFRWKELF